MISVSSSVPISRCVQSSAVSQFLDELGIVWVRGGFCFFASCRLAEYLKAVFAELIEKLAHCFGLKSREIGSLLLTEFIEFIHSFSHLTEFIEFSHLTEFNEFSQMNSFIEFIHLTEFNEFSQMNEFNEFS